jgi:hypothetical protein
LDRELREVEVMRVAQKRVPLQVKMVAKIEDPRADAIGSM